MFVSVNLIDTYYSTITITLPVVNHDELRKRINDFIQKKNSKYLSGIKNSHLYKKLFQKNSLELVAFPQRKLDKKSISCGDLLVCALSPEKGVILCFIPSVEPPAFRCAEIIINKFQEKDYPNCSNASTGLFSSVAISFLVYEEGMIDVDTSGACTLQGLEISLLRYQNAHQTLFCRKFNSNLLIQSPSYVMGMREVVSDYVLIDCVCSEKNFHFQIGLPIFSQAEVDVKICSARQSRAAFLNLHFLRENAYLRFMKIFPNQTTHHVIAFPDPMYLSLPFGLIKKGQLLFSQKKRGCILQFTSIGDSFVSGEKKKSKNSIIFYDWQVGSPSYTQTNQSTQNITCFSDPSVTIVRKEGSNEFLVVGAQIKLICSGKGTWGVCFFRDGTSSSELQEATTLISCTKKESNFVMEQGPSSRAQLSSDFDPSEGTSPHSEQSSSNFDPSEGTSPHSEQSSSNFDPSEGTSPHSEQSSSNFDPSEGTSPHSEQSSSDFDPGEGTSQCAKKRSAACLELNFADQGPWCSSEHVPKKGNFKGIKSSTQVILLSPGPLDDPNQRLLAQLTASMVKLPVDSVPLQSASFQLPDLPLFTLKESQKTTSDSNPFGLGTETEAFQDTMSSLITTSSRFFQQNSSSITYSESTSTTSLEISSISQEAKQSNEEIWEDLCAIIDAVPFQSASLQLPDVPSFTLKESQKTTSDSNSYGAKLSLDCDPEEGPSQGATKRSDEYLGLHFADPDALWNLEEEVFQDATKRSDEYLGLHFADPDALWNLEEEAFQDATKRSDEYLGLHFADPDALWNLEEEAFQDATKRSDEYLGLHFADPDVLWNLEEEAFQDETKRSKEYLGLKSADQDPLWSSASNPPSSFSKDK